MSSTATTAVVDTAKVAERRRVHYDDVQGLLRDAEQLAAGGYEQLGNWTLGRIATHVAAAMRMALDGPPMMAPWPVRCLARLIYKNSAIRGPMKPGFKLPAKAAKDLVADESTTDEQGVAALREVVERWDVEPRRHPHPFLGKLTPDEWNRLSLRHAEMHMSFLRPKS